LLQLWRTYTVADKCWFKKIILNPSGQEVPFPASSHHRGATQRLTSSALLVFQPAHGVARSDHHVSIAAFLADQFWHLGDKRRHRAA
jgi:hypothetical protein